MDMVLSTVRPLAVFLAYRTSHLGYKHHTVCISFLTLSVYTLVKVSLEREKSRITHSNLHYISRAGKTAQWVRGLCQASLVTRV